MNLIGGRQRILQPSFHIQKKKRSGLQRNLIFNQGGRGGGGGGGGGGECRKMCVPLEKILATRLIRTQMID